MYQDIMHYVEEWNDITEFLNEYDRDRKYLFKYFKMKDFDRTESTNDWIDVVIKFLDKHPDFKDGIFQIMYFDDSDSFMICELDLNHQDNFLIRKFKKYLKKSFWDEQVAKRV